LSIQDLLYIPHVGKEYKDQRFRFGAYAPSPSLRLSGLSSRLIFAIRLFGTIRTRLMAQILAGSGFLPRACVFYKNHERNATPELRTYLI